MKTKLLLSTFILLVASTAFTQKSPIYKNGVGAIEGYDAVAYFEEAEPIKGSKEFTTEWNGSTWHFSSSENLKMFEENPEKYAPQFGGYCAYAVSQGYTYKSDPEAWKIINGKLYLNYSKKIQQKWEKDQANFIMLGEANWPKVIEK